MNYRKLKKKFVKRFGYKAKLTFRDKSDKILVKSSKKATAIMMKRYIYDNSSVLDLFVLRKR